MPPMGLKVLKGLKFDTAFGCEGCGGTLKITKGAFMIKPI